MRIFCLFLVGFFAWNLRAENRIWMDATVNGQPVHMGLDTGASVSALFRGTADRLKLKVIPPPDGIHPSPGEMVFPTTELCDFAYLGQTGRVQFAVIEMPSFVETEAEGILSWQGIRSNVFVFDPDKNQLDVRSAVPPGVSNWSKFKQRTAAKTLAFEAGGADSNLCVYIDTGAQYGIALSPALWMQWAATHTNQAATINSSISVTTGAFHAKEMWADVIQIGNLLLYDVPVMEMNPKSAETDGMPKNAARLGMYALRRMHFVLDGVHGAVYARPFFGQSGAYIHNQLGAEFAPLAEDGDRLLAHVGPGSPADLAGIRDGDELLKVDGIDVTHWQTAGKSKSLMDYWSDFPPGTPYKLALKRGEKEYRTTVALKSILAPDTNAPLHAIDPILLAGLEAKAEAGDVTLQYELGELYYYGVNGLAKDEAVAVKWFRKAALRDHAGAQSYMGTCFSRGRGVPVNLPEAVKWWQLAARQNYASAQCDLGVCYLNGLGVPKDQAEGIKYFRLAAQQNFAVAQSYLGVAYFQGNGVARDLSEAVKWYRKAVAQNGASAQNNLGICYANGLGVEKNVAEALRLFRKSAAQGYASAQCNLGGFYLNGVGLNKDEFEALKWYRKAAEQNDAKAQSWLGLCYAKGWGTVKNISEAMQWWQKAAEQDFVEAQWNLAICYSQGRGVATNETEAVKWYRRAAELNHPKAQFNLGARYASGLGVAKDEAEAIKWYRKAAEQNDAEAQARMGICYGTGFGVPKDNEEAVKWWRLAAAQNDASAQCNLAICLAGGRGVSKDKVEGYKWALLSAAQGHPDGKKFGDLLAQELTPKEILEAQNRARNFKPSVTPPIPDNTGAVAPNLSNSQ